MIKIIFDDVEVVQGGMIILPKEITERLLELDIVETIPKEISVSMSTAEIKDMLLRPIYRLPLKWGIVNWIERSYNEFMRNQRDGAVIERIKTNKIQFIDSFNKSYEEARLIENIYKYVKVCRWIGKSETLDKLIVKERIEKEIILDVLTALTEIHGKTKYNIFECYIKDDEWNI